MKLLQWTTALSLVCIGLAHAGAVDMATGDVVNVNRAGKQITLKHGEIRSVSMPPMTMPYQVKDVSLLNKVQTGDKVRFTAEKTGAGILVTDIQVVK